ncbi:MAG: DUF1003 domain-containing protein [Bacteroidales bacterium]|jgi:uncharacterized membrane protein
MKKKAICQITKEELPISELVPALIVREPLVKLIKKQYPGWDENGYISSKELNKFRNEYVKNIVEVEKGELTEIEKEVIESIKNAEILSKNLSEDTPEISTFGERTADKVASFGGSWKFIGIFAFVLIVWITINTIALFQQPFDPFPYILLNLILSCLAAIQAPVIMMSQNRQEARDRIRAQHDYQVNLKAEIEIRQLNEKIDHLILVQNQKDAEIQQIQIELLNDLIEKVENIEKKKN